MMAEQHKQLKMGMPVAAWQTLPLHAACWVFALVLLASSGSAAARQVGEPDATIQHLIAYVEQSDVTFERNFTRHDAAAAAAHIEKKYQHFRDRIESPEQFIELCATASLLTGMQYMIIDGQGNGVPASEWLNTELLRYRNQKARQ